MTDVLIMAVSRDPMNRWPTSWQALIILGGCPQGATEAALAVRGIPIVTLELLVADGFAAWQLTHPRGLVVHALLHHRRRPESPHQEVPAMMTMDELRRRKAALITDDRQYRRDLIGLAVAGSLLLAVVAAVSFGVNAALFGGA